MELALVKGNEKMYLSGGEGGAMRRCVYLEREGGCINQHGKQCAKWRENESLVWRMCVGEVLAVCLLVCVVVGCLFISIVRE